MTTSLVQVAVLPLSGTRRASLSDSFSNTRRLNITAIDSRDGARSSPTRILCRDTTCDAYGDRKLGSRRLSRKNLCVTRCSAEKAAYAVKEVTDEDLEKQVQASDIRVLAAIRSSYNYITVMEVAREADHLLAGARLLLLDNPGCIHTVWYEHNVLTNSYYDALATVVPLLPEGPVGILGLGAGATSHVLHHFFPTLETHGWELDPDIVRIARQFFNLSELEESDTGKLTTTTTTTITSFVDQVVASHEDEGRRPGKLTVHIGDAVSPHVGVEGGFAGLIVDLFAEGRVIPALQRPHTWEQLKAKLKPGGRIIVNCGGDRVMAGEQPCKSAGQVCMEETVAAMSEVFAGELSTRYLATKGFNTIAITGPSPDLELWREALPEPLRDGVSEWKPVALKVL